MAGPGAALAPEISEGPEPFPKRWLAMGANYPGAESNPGRGIPIRATDGQAALVVRLLSLEVCK